MMLVDVNLLIYAYNRSSPLHGRAERWLERAFSGGEAVALPWTVIHAFLRFTTSAIVGAQPLSIMAAAAIVDDWLHRPAVITLDPGQRYWSILRKILEAAQIRGAMVSDAHLAALAIENGATLFTTDKDFARFDELRVINPLA